MCLHCKRSVSARNGNTSNLFSHLRTNHSKQYELASFTKKKPQQATDNATPTTTPWCVQLTIAESLSQSQKYDWNSKRWKQLTDFITSCLPKDMLSMLPVEKVGFKRMVAIFDKWYDLPGCKYFAQAAIPALYNRIKDQVSQEIREANYYSATTVCGQVMEWSRTWAIQFTLY